MAWWVVAQVYLSHRPMSRGSIIGATTVPARNPEVSLSSNGVHAGVHAGVRAGVRISRLYTHWHVLSRTCAPCQHVAMCQPFVLIKCKYDARHASAACT